MSDLDTKVSGIGAYLTNARLAIPDYQRSYSWRRDEEVKDLWDDIAGAITNKQPEYFLGAVVVIDSPDDERAQVIDGQQRLATISLLYAAIRDIFQARSDDRAQEITQDVLGKKDRSTRAITQFLKLNAEDNAYFRQLTLVDPSERTLAPSADSHVRLQEAYDFMTDRFLGLIDGLGATEWPAPLVGWDDFVMNHAQIIEVSVPNESRGFVIFETLNDRGMNLSTADLLKNHVLGMSGTRIEESKTRWARAIGPFIAPDNQLDMEMFLRHFWASRQGVVRVKDLFWQMKAAIADPEQAVAFAGELADASRIWTAMFERDSDIWSGYGPGALAAVDVLRNLKVEQCRPLVLAALRKFGTGEVEKLLSLVVNWSVRWIVVGGGSAGTTERIYATTAKKITDGVITTAGQVASEFDAFVPGDLAFEQAFATAAVRRGWLARYYLQVLERKNRGQAEPELVPNENVEEVNLEHVLPKSGTVGDWPQFSPEEAELLIMALGNQCLMKKTPNQALGNKPFADKAPELQKSEFLLTREVGNEADWGPGQVRTRQQRMAKIAVSAWPKA